MQNNTLNNFQSGVWNNALPPSCSSTPSTLSSAQIRRGRYAMRSTEIGTVNSCSTFTASNGIKRKMRPSIFSLSRNRDMDLDKMYNAIEKGHKVCKLLLLKKWDPSYKKLSFNRDTRQILLSKYETSSGKNASIPNFASSKTTSTLDLRLVKEAHTLEFKLNNIKIADKWKKDKEIQRFNSEMILVKMIWNCFGITNKLCKALWLKEFREKKISVESKEACRLWSEGINHLKKELEEASHYLLIECWLRKQFYNIMNPDTSTITIKHMKPFVQTKLQCKVQSKQLQEIIEGEMGFEAFVVAHNRLLNFASLFALKFSEFGDESQILSLRNFVKFINQFQGDEIGKSPEIASNFLRRYLRDVDLSRDVPEPYLTAEEFVDYLFSDENTMFNPLNREVVQDMTRPLTHYWIASSHNTYLTGDQLKSESSLDVYARALLMGCRCIELDCWDGQRKSSSEFIEIVIYHGYTITSKLNLRDVLYTIKHYAFITSQYPVILSIEDNCSVPAQRQMAQDIREILGDMLLTQPVSRDEWQLPSPESMKNKIILKHKKLQLDEGDSILSHQSLDEDQDQDILSRECTKRGVLYLRDNARHLWTKHIFLLFTDRLCYLLDPVETVDLNKSDNQADEESINSWHDSMDDSSLSVFGVRPEEMHVTEEWFHGKVGRDVAKDRLLEQAGKGNGVFLVRESGTFIGDYTLSFLHDGIVNHCRIKTAMVGGEKKYYFFEPLKRDTLYELISYYTKHPIDAPSFKAYLLTPCPQPQPHLNEPWFCEEADKQRAEELLSTVKEDGAFLIRYSSSDHNVFVLSLRVDGEFWHYRLKRDGRIFVVNQMVFENLNQIVNFYSDRDFMRGICLKYPINERTVGRYASSELSAVAPGCYMELKDLDKEVEAISIMPYCGANPDHLTFPANVHINVIYKSTDMWKGLYNGSIGWFPPDYVREINSRSGTLDSAMNYETIELAGSTFESFESDRLFSFRISQSSSPWNVQEYIVAAESREEMDEWLVTMDALTRTVNDKINLLRTKEKQLRIANELSSLVVYCQAVPFNFDFLSQDPRTTFYEMCSFSESKHEKLVEKGLVLFNSRQLSRVYPQASRLTSTNFNPTPMWNSGCHMVALNYQTGDRAMQLNEGKFSANGRCGYVLKPQYLMDETFKPDAINSTPLLNSPTSPSLPNGSQFSFLFENIVKMLGHLFDRQSLTLQIIAGRHLSRKDQNKGICSPFVEVEIVGLPHDSIIERTSTITSNGLNPVWQDTFNFNILRPEMALIRFLVEDGDFVGPKTDPFIGQAVFPIDCIRSGYRSVPLFNQFSEPLELSALLVYAEIGPLELTNEKRTSLMHSNGPATNLAFESAMTLGGLGTQSSCSLSSINISSDAVIQNPHAYLQAGRLNSQSFSFSIDGSSIGSTFPLTSSNRSFVDGEPDHLPDLSTGTTSEQSGSTSSLSRSQQQPSSLTSGGNVVSATKSANSRILNENPTRSISVDSTELVIQSNKSNLEVHYPIIPQRSHRVHFVKFSNSEKFEIPL